MRPPALAGLVIQNGEISYPVPDERKCPFIQGGDHEFATLTILYLLTGLLLLLAMIP